tara:strand:- start:1391 stop:1540 length:150 start_codon:yes stop_codon:yes gene_type:complete
MRNVWVLRMEIIIGVLLKNRIPADKGDVLHLLLDDYSPNTEYEREEGDV